VWDYYATGDRSTAKIYVVNQSAQPLQHAIVSVAYYALDGSRKFFHDAGDINLGPHTSSEAMAIVRIKDAGPVYFVKCELRDISGSVIADNTYWSSRVDDDLGSAFHGRSIQDQFGAMGRPLGAQYHAAGACEGLRQALGRQR